jgi:UPF0755 protein
MNANQNEDNTQVEAVQEQSFRDTSFDVDYRPTPQKSRLKALFVWFVFCVLLFVVLNFSYHFFISPPTDFPTDEPIEIVLGTSVVNIARQLKEAEVVRSEFLLYAVLVAYYEPTDIKASTYSFSTPLSVYEVAEALTEGNYSYDLVRFTHKEGMSVKALAPEIATLFPHITESEFVAYATPFEGELFPETYFVPKDITLEDLVALMRELYASTTQPLYATSATHTLSASDILILASILEREANSLESMQEVANILLRRLAIDMPLQVDATLEYILDKPLSKLTTEDLEIDSPYNTYKYYGLPPTPIGNPGADALNAVIHATTATPYLFYITGEDGNFYYAKNFDEHRTNVERYLK